MNWGFAYIEKYTSHKGEKEVLFNPINVFKIVEYVPDKQVEASHRFKMEMVYVRLEFGGMESLIKEQGKESNQ